MLKKFLALLLISQAAFASGKLQNEDFKTLAELQGAGGTMAQLLNDTKVFVTGASQQLSTFLSSLAAAASSSSFVNNAGLSDSVALNALTVNLTTANGSTPSGGSVVSISYRNSSSTTGQYASFLTTAALSIVVPAGATLGQVSGAAEYTYIYAQNNGGTSQLCASTSSGFDEGSVQTTTTISAGATARNTLYCTAGATGPVRLLGRLLSTQTTAGLWAASPSEISLAPFKITQIVPQYATITGDMVTPTVASQSGNWITSITRNGLGDYTLHINSGTWSAAPSCTISPFVNSTVLVNFITAYIVAASSSSVETGTYYGPGGAYFDYSYMITCMGPR